MRFKVNWLLLALATEKTHFTSTQLNLVWHTKCWNEYWEFYNTITIYTVQISIFTLKNRSHNEFPEAQGHICIIHWPKGHRANGLCSKSTIFEMTTRAIQKKVRTLIGKSFQYVHLVNIPNVYRIIEKLIWPSATLWSRVEHINFSFDFLLFGVLFWFSNSLLLWLRWISNQWNTCVMHSNRSDIDIFEHFRQSQDAILPRGL